MIGLRPLGQEKPYTCGVATIRAVLKYWGTEESEEKLARVAGVGESGTSHEQMRSIAKRAGYGFIEEYPASIEDISRYVEAQIPVIVNYQDYGEINGENGHYAVVVDVKEKIGLADPAEGGKYKWFEKKEFLRRWFDNEAAQGKDKRWMAVILPTPEGDQ